MKKLIYENRVILAILLAWMFINFICLMLAKDLYYSKDVFFPFTENSLKYSYDITEFIVYGISPIVLFVIIKLINNEKN
jgi:hypothetical protein